MGGQEPAHVRTLWQGWKLPFFFCCSTPLWRLQALLAPKCLPPPAWAKRPHRGPSPPALWQQPGLAQPGLLHIYIRFMSGLDIAAFLLRFPEHTPKGGEKKSISVKCKTSQGKEAMSIVSAQWHSLMADLVHGNFKGSLGIMILWLQHLRHLW